MELVSSWATARPHLLSLGSHMDLTIDHLHCDLFYLTTLRASFIPPLFFPCAYHHLIHALIFPCLCIPFQQVRFSCIPQASLGSHVLAVSPLCSPFSFLPISVSLHSPTGLISAQYTSVHSVLSCFPFPPSQQCLISPLRCHLIFVYISRRT